MHDRLQCHEEEKAELAAVLASGLFDRAPSLERLLVYVCDRYFAGEAHSLKEYNIGTEALGRPAGYDQKKDSIVRVEAHRLRKHLRRYYESDGSGHALHLEIPLGQYGPSFVRRPMAAALPAEWPPVPEAAPPEPVLVAPALVTPVVPPSPPPRPSPRRLYLIAASLLLGAVAMASWGFRPLDPAAHAATLRDTARPAPPPDGEEIRILAGAQKRYVDLYGNVWQPDRFFTGGWAASSPQRAIRGTADPTPFLSRREGASRYDIPLPDRPHELHLYFSEFLFGEGNTAGGGETTRLFNVLLNGRPALELFDVLADAGGANVADIKVFKDVRPAPDGKLRIEFAAVGQPFVNAIAVLPGLPGRQRPLRFTARHHAYTDASGERWDMDRFVTGGQMLLRTDPVLGLGDPNLLRGERFGNLRYSLPVATGSRYTVRLYFAESWFGPDQMGGGGTGSRLFDVHCNGTALLRNFDVFKEAGGSRKAVVKTFRHLEANAQGKIDLAFVPVRNYALVNAIEVVDEGVAQP